MRPAHSSAPIAACLGIAVYSVMDTLMKRLSIDSGAYVAVLWRSVAGVALMVPVFVARRQRWPRGAVLRLHLWRGLAAGGSVMLFFYGLARVPMAQAVAITFLAPLIAILLAAAMLGERVRRAAILGSVVAAAGVLVIAAGEASAAASAATVEGTIAIFAASILYAASLVLLRRQAQVADPLEVALFASLVIGAAMLPAAPWAARVADARPAAGDRRGGDAGDGVGVAHRLGLCPRRGAAARAGRIYRLRLGGAARPARVRRAGVGVDGGRRAADRRRLRRRGARQAGGGAADRGGGVTLVRAATIADVATVLRFVRELAAFEHEADAVVATEAMLADALFGDAPAAEAVIAEVAGAPAGFALFFHNFSTWTGRRGVYLEDLYVTPAARGHGVGRALLAHLAALAVERGCARLEWSVLDWNVDAIAFYRAVGAVGMEEWTVQRLAGDALARAGGAGLMAIDEGLYAWVAEAVEPLGAVTRRSMMGGATLYCDGVVFAILALDALWFKADALSDAVWDAAGAARFGYERDGKLATMNYRRAPDDAYDDPDALREWARLAIEAGARTPRKKPRRSSGR